VTARIVFVLSLLAVSLAACAAPPPRTTATPAPTSDGAPATPQPAKPVAGYTVRPAQPPSGKAALENLPGMNAAGITKMLGAPQFRRRDGQVEIWQYRAANCTLDIFLYAEGGDMLVRYVEPRGRTAQVPAQATATTAANDPQVRACATGLLQSRAGS
jgi:hypothetical protein